MDLITNFISEGKRKQSEFGYHLLGIILCSSRNPGSLTMFLHIFRRTEIACMTGPFDGFDK
jgi:hypothetical protein